MLRRYRRIVFALSGLAVAALADAQPIGRDASNREAAAQSEEQPQRDPSPARPVTIQDFLDRIAGALEAANTKPAPPEDRQRARDDLRAQESMAVWAQAMFWATAASVVFTMIGVWLVWLNLREARKVTREAIRSADAARDAADEAKKATAAANTSVEEARETNRIARETAINEQRPWVAWRLINPSFTYEGPNNFRFRSDLIAENSGHTPAMEVDFSTRVIVITNVGIKDFAHSHRREHMHDYNTTANLPTISMLPGEELDPINLDREITIEGNLPDFLSFLVSIHCAYKFFDKSRIGEIGSVYIITARGEIGPFRFNKSYSGYQVFDVGLAELGGTRLIT